jgi:hypothetical protein
MLPSAQLFRLPRANARFNCAASWLWLREKPAVSGVVTFITTLTDREPPED